MTRAPRPDFLVIGAPKAGTTALHAALAQHPDVFVSDPKEPKYWLCDGAPPPAWCGPGDKHSQQEWIWRADHYFPLFEPAGEHQVRGESTPVLPVEPRRPPPDRRGPAGRAPRGRRPGPDRPRLQQLDAPVVRRAGARVGLRHRLRPRGGAGARRLGAVLALPRAGPLRRAAPAPAPVRRSRTDPGRALPRPGGRARRDRRPGQPVPRHPRGTGRLDPAGQLAQLRAARLAAAALRAGRPQRSARSASSSRPRCGGASTRCRSTCSATVATPPARGSTPYAGSGSWTRTPTTSAC